MISYLLIIISQKRPATSTYSEESYDCSTSALGVDLALADYSLQKAKKQFSKIYKQYLEKKQLIFLLKHFSISVNDFENSAGKMVF